MALRASRATHHVAPRLHRPSLTVEKRRLSGGSGVLDGRTIGRLLRPVRRRLDETRCEMIGAVWADYRDELLQRASADRRARQDVFRRSDHAPATPDGWRDVLDVDESNRN